MAELVVSSIAAFPWVHCDELIEVGPVRIIPYRRGLAPGDTPHAKQADIDTIMAAWADRPGQLVMRAALLEIDDYRAGMDDSAHAFRLFEAKKLIAFAALAKRRLFGQHFGYCNADTYAGRAALCLRPGGALFIHQSATRRRRQPYVGDR